MPRKVADLKKVADFLSSKKYVLKLSFFLLRVEGFWGFGDFKYLIFLLYEI